MMNYTNNGIANVAQSLANKGRNGDTELVHMSPREVNGLQALARANGTSLTMNPNTGLPEAFRLEQLLPMAAGAALTIGSGGALSPLAASLLVGGGYGAATGSIEKGLMAGIGAYGGAGIATGVTGAASQGAIETSATNALGVPAGTPAPAPISPEFTPTDPFLDSVPVTSAAPVTPSPSQASTLAAQNASMGLNPMQSAANISSSAGYASGATPMPMSSQAVNLGSSGIENIFTKEGATAAYKGMPTGTLPATAGTLLMAGQQQPNVPGYQEDAYDRRLKGYKLSPNYQPYQAPTPNPYYRPTYAADGGVMNSFDDSSGMDEPAGLAQGNLQKGLFGLGYAGGGLSLGGYSDGGRMLKGPGDGMSDSIPGVIGGKQPARLADGEFVVPADVVSHLGNGSTDAGAKKLYSMMDKIRQARTGKKKQAPQVNVDKYLPMGKASGGITGYAEGGEVKRFQNEGVVASNPYAGQSIQSTEGINYGYDDIVKQVNQRYEENKSPALVAKSALALGLPENVILSLPGVTQAALNQGRDLISSGAFGAYNPSEANAPVVAAPVGSTQYNARIAAGLDAYGFPPEEVAYKKSIGQYEDNPLPTLNTVIAPTSVPSPVTTTQTPQTYSDQAVNSFVRDMINNGVGGAEIGRALAANGISQAQAVTATGLDAGIVAQSYAGGASLPAISSAANLPIRPTSEATIPNFGANQVASYLVTNNITTPAEEAEVQRMFNVNNTTLAEAKRLIAATDPSIQAATDAYQRSIQANPNLAIQNALTTEARMKDLGITSGIPNAVAATERAAVQKAAADKQAAIDKFNETASKSIAAYRPSFVPRVSGISMSPTMQDPYSDIGLKSLYEQMMGQYKAPTQPMSDTDIRTFAQNFARDNPGKGAELGQALINKGIPVNQAIAATGLSPGTVNTAYIGGQALGTAAPPTLNTQYNYSDPGSYYRPAPVSNLVLKNPITDAVTAETNQAKADAVAAANASTAGDAGGAGGERAGGLMSIDRKKRAKYKK